MENLTYEHYLETYGHIDLNFNDSNDHNIPFEISHAWVRWAYIDKNRRVITHRLDGPAIISNPKFTQKFNNGASYNNRKWLCHNSYIEDWMKHQGISLINPSTEEIAYIKLIFGSLDEKTTKNFLAGYFSSLQSE